MLTAFYFCYIFCAEKSDYEIGRVARQLRITGLQADVQKENMIAEQQQKCTTGKGYLI